VWWIAYASLYTTLYVGRLLALIIAADRLFGTRLRAG
jgi:hypothetical protein